MFTFFWVNKPMFFKCFAYIVILDFRLVRYLYPTDDELRLLAGVPKDKGKGKKGSRHIENGKSCDTFHVPRNLDIQVTINNIWFEGNR